jgi:hypothetical protein
MRIKRQVIPAGVLAEIKFLQRKRAWYTFLTQQAVAEDNPLVDEFRKMAKEYTLKLDTVEKLWGRK